MSVDVAIRLGLQGGQFVERTMDDIGRKGSGSLREIKAAANDLSPGMVALSRGVAGVNDAVDGLASRAGTLGSVARSFGGLGTAVAAGAVAVGLAATAVFDQTRRAMAFADEIEDAAGKVGAGVEALQEYRFAIVDAGGDAKDADTAIASFNKTLGAAQSGLSAKAMKPFEALGFSKEQVREFKDFEDALPEVANRIAELGSEAERAAVAEKLGLTPLLPLLRKGSDEIARLRDEAQRLGLVMEEDLVKKGADASRQFEVASQVISLKLKVAFVELAPAIASIVTSLAEATAKVVDFFTTSRREAALTEFEIQRERVDDLQRSSQASRDRAASARRGTVGAVLSGMSVISALDPQKREAFADEQDANAQAQADRAFAELRRLEDLRDAIDAPASRSPAPVSTDGTSLFDVGGDDSDGAAKREAAERKRLGDVVAEAMGQEAVEARKLEETLADLDRARAKGIITTDAELALLKERATYGKVDDELAKSRVRVKEAEAEAEAMVADALRKRRDSAMAEAQGVREANYTPEQWKAAETEKLNAILDASAGTEAALSDDEIDRALSKIEERYRAIKEQVDGVTLSQQILRGVISGQVRSWADLGQVALAVLTDIIQRAAQATAIGRGSFLENLVTQFGSQVFGSWLGGGFKTEGMSEVASFVDNLPANQSGRAAGGPVYRGDRRPVGEYGVEMLTAASDGFVHDAAATAAAMRATLPVPGASGDGMPSIVINNNTSTPVRATPRMERDQRGRPRVALDLVEAMDSRVDARFGELFSGKDDSKLAGNFGVRPRLSRG